MRLLTLMKLGLSVVSFCLVSQSGFARENHPNWADGQAKSSITWILKNYQYTQVRIGGLPGALVASPGSAFDNSNSEQQNYQFSWVRDTAVVMRTIVDLYIDATDPIDKARFKQMLFDYADFSARNQNTITQAGLGEPKFFVNGQAFNDPWGRPQNDGPALRAMTLIAFAEQLINEGHTEKATPIFEIVKKDLNYVAKNHANKSFDIWEENYAIHFATLNFQQASLVAGARLAEKLQKQNDESNAWKNETISIRRRMNDFRRGNDNFIEASQDSSAGHVQNKDKPSNLDVAVLISSLYAQDSLSADDNFAFRPTSSWLLSTAEKMRVNFEQLYPINERQGFFAGRYPEDKYFSGNPWAIATFTFAEYYFQVAQDFAKGGSIVIDDLNREFFKHVLPARYQYLVRTNKTILANTKEFMILIRNLGSEGDAILEAVKEYIPATGEISEQLSKTDGHAVALPNLSWSHSAFIRAQRAQTRLNKILSDYDHSANEIRPVSECVAELKP